MDGLTLFVVISAMLGSAVIGGVFFAFSAFVLRALRKLSASQGVRAMQSINVVVLNPLFLGPFFGTALLSVVAIGLAARSWGDLRATLMIAGGATYLVGTFGVTIVGNVPLNNALERVAPKSPEAAEFWPVYCRRWVLWNHLRTACGVAAALLFALALSGE